MAAKNKIEVLGARVHNLKNIDVDVPLNKTIGSKTRKPRLVLEPPISPFATWIPILQDCEAVKPEPAIFSR